MNKVQVEHLSNFLFKFYFSKKEDNDIIYARLPWSFNGSQVNLNLWNLNIHFLYVNFDTLTFHL